MRRFVYIAILLLVAWNMQSQELLNYPLDTIHGEEVYRYEVERSVGLYRIGLNFNVPQSEIIRLNPQLRERGLHFGETLYLPTGRKVEEKKAEPIAPKEPEIIQEIPASVDTVSTDSIVTDSLVTGSLVTDSLVTDSVVTKSRKVIELALLLPFESQQTKRSGNADKMLEFYQGALLALHDLQNDSLLYRLHVYDSERSERRVNALCDTTVLDSIRGVLGLVYPIQITRMAAWCEAHQVPLLLPFSDDMPLGEHPQLLQFNSTDLQEARNLCLWLQAHDSLIHCLSIETRGADLPSSIRTLREQVQVAGIACTPVPLQDVMSDSILYALDNTKENIIILHTDRYQHARLVLPHLIKLQEQGYRIRIISQYSWQKESIGLPQLYTSMFKTDASHVVYDTLWEQSFVNGHKSETPRYDLLGYDLMQALVGWLDGQTVYNGLQSDIRWEQVQEGGWQNTAVRVVEIEN